MAGPAQPSPSSGSSRWYRPVNNFHPHAPMLRHRLGAKLLGGTMVFWILYRAKEDGAVMLGLRHPWDGHHGHGDHGHGNGHEESHH